jgi:trehalose 6-phosphate phosphatase
MMIHAEAGALEAAVRARFGAELPALLFLDVDGTLAPIAPKPEDALVPEASLAILAELASADGVYVALVSGRSSADAKRMVPVEGLWAIGNHGMELLTPEGELVADERAAEWEPRISVAAERLQPILARWEGIFLEDKRWTLSVHHRLAPEDDAAAARGELQTLASELEIAITYGKQVIELRPPIDVHKGTAVVDLARRLVGKGLEAALLYVGDDRTDEDAFVGLRAAAPHSLTIRVAGGAESSAATFAEFEVRDVAAVSRLLALVRDVRRQAGG